MIRTIAVIGATGKLGRPVTSHLLQSGFTVKAFVRRPEKSELLPAGIQLVKGDLRNPDDLRSLFEHADAVYTNLSIQQHEKPVDWHAEVHGLENILNVARQAGVKRIAMISSLVQRYQGMNGFHWWAFDVKEKAVQMLKQSGIPYTIFYPSTFFENFEWNYKLGRNLILAGESTGKQYFISAYDYGRQVARMFLLNADGNKEYFVQGPEPFTTEEATHVFREYYSREKLVISKAPLGLLKFLGTFVQKLNYAAHILEALNRYPETFQASTTWEELGKPTITLKDYASSF